MKIIKYGLIAMLGITLSLVALYLITAKSMEFHFANMGKIVCVEHRDWGFITREGETTCFAVTQLNSGVDQLITTVQNLDKGGEIILKK